MRTSSLNIKLPDIVGKGYKDFWHFKGRYCVCKGGRGSKKSKTSALWHIFNIMKYPQSNALVIRKTERTLRDSCFADLVWATKRLKVEEFWKTTVNPLEMVYSPTGQKILFRGMDDALKLTSISVATGTITFVWIEEAYEITKESDFDFLDESIRGEVPDGLFKRITIIFNPWSAKHWLKSRFFDKPNTENKLSMTTTYLCNEWLDDSDRAVFDEMKERNPARWKVAACGDWGILEGLIYENCEEKDFDVDQIRHEDCAESAFGLDFGYSVDPAALVCSIVLRKRKTIYVYDELYEKGLTNIALAERIKNLGLQKEKIVADAAEPKSIQELYDLGIFRIVAARKGPDSIRNGIQLIQNYKIIIHPKCVNFLREIGNYCWEKDKFGNYTGRPVDFDNHAMDAARYAWTNILRGEIFSF